MDLSIDDLMLVRATNIIPFEGVIKPISDDRYLTKTLASSFEGAISDLLLEEGIMPAQDYEKTFEDENYYDEYVKKCGQITKEYLPYVSDYNSIVLFSLNGICPDDSEHGFGNNTFSNKHCAVIEPLKYHMEEVISLVPTDTAIKGTVILSKEAILLINDDTFNDLSEDEKNRLLALPFKLTLFKGNLKENIKKTLKEMGVPSEDLSLSREAKGIKDSDTSDNVKRLIDELIIKYDLSRKKYFDLITARTNEEIPKYDLVKDEYDNAVRVYDYYLECFLSTLLVFLEAPENIRVSLHRNLHNNAFMKQIAKLIKNKGMANYKLFVDEYNAKLEKQRKNGDLKTPNEILSIKENEKANLQSEKSQSVIL